MLDSANLTNVECEHLDAAHVGMPSGRACSIYWQAAHDCRFIEEGGH